MLGGGFEVLKAACQRVESKVPVVVVAGTGPAADFIAEAFKAFNAKEQQSVIQALFQ